MRVTEQLLHALNRAESGDIEDAGASLGYLRRGKRRGRRGGRILLIAAVLMALLTGTAYAAGWFGLSSRLTEAEDSTPYAGDRPGQTENETPTTHYLSFNDYANTPAAKAHAEWNVFWWNYMASHSIDNASEYQWQKQIGPEMTAIARIYGCGDQSMLDKLLEIRDRYGVRLHTAWVFPDNTESFYQLSGLKPFFRGKGEIQMQYLFEDGSFKAEGQAAPDGKGYPFTLVRGAKGALDPASNTEDRAAEYEEWTYQTTKGAEITIALGPAQESEGKLEGAGWRSFYLFYDCQDYVVTVMSALPQGDREAVQTMAECFDFAVLAGGKTDLSPVTQAKPREIKPKDGLMTLADFVKTDEYKASSEFRSAVCDWADGLEENKGHVPGLSVYNYYGSFPPKIPEVRAAAEDIENRYDLEMPHAVRAVLGGGEVDPDSVTSGLGQRVPEGKSWEECRQERSQEELWEILGVEPFTQNGKLFHLFRYDTGAFFCNIVTGSSGYDLHYIPKGTFYPLFRFVLHPELTGWAYDTACGVQVYLVHGGDMEYPHSGIPYVLYETETAYVIAECYADDSAYTLQSVADDIDFTKFP